MSGKFEVSSQNIEFFFHFHCWEQKSKYGQSNKCKILLHILEKL